MNERIQELIDKATLTCMEADPAHSVPAPNIRFNQVYAQLIVRECANHCDLLLDHKISSEWSRGTHDCSRAIKKHFGVEL